MLAVASESKRNLAGCRGQCAATISYVVARMRIPSRLGKESHQLKKPQLTTIKNTEADILFTSGKAYKAASHTVHSERQARMGYFQYIRRTLVR